MRNKKQDIREKTNDTMQSTTRKHIMFFSVPITYLLLHQGGTTSTRTSMHFIPCLNFRLLMFIGTCGGDEPCQELRQSQLIIILYQLFKLLKLFGTCSLARG